MKVIGTFKGEEMVAGLIDYTFKVCGCKGQELGEVGVRYLRGMTCTETLLLSFTCTYSLDQLPIYLFTLYSSHIWQGASI